MLPQQLLLLAEFVWSSSLQPAPHLLLLLVLPLPLLLRTQHPAAPSRPRTCCSYEPSTQQPAPTCMMRKLLLALTA